MTDEVSSEARKTTRPTICAERREGAERGDFAMALRIADLGLTTHPSTPSLVAVRTRALEGLRAKYQLSPFKFIVYSEAARAELAPPP